MADGSRDLTDDEVEAIHESALAAAAHDHRGATPKNPFKGVPTAASLWRQAYDNPGRNRR